MPIVEKLEKEDKDSIFKDNKKDRDNNLEYKNKIDINLPNYITLNI